jgi:hypothetical protein
MAGINDEFIGKSKKLFAYRREYLRERSSGEIGSPDGSLKQRIACQQARGSERSARCAWRCLTSRDGGSIHD